MIKLIATDFDGTLRPEGMKRMTEKTEAYLEQLIEEKMHIVIASGRQYASLYKRMGKLCDKVDYILENGSLVISQGEILDKQFIDREAGRELMETIVQIPSCEVMVSGVHTVYMQPKQEAYYKYVTEVVGNTVTVVDDLLTDIPEEYLKISIFDFGGVEPHVPYFTEKYGQQLSVAWARPMWIDVGPQGVDKGTAMEVFKKKYNITKEEIIAFGDAGNDIPLLKAAGTSYAMSEGSEDVIKASDYQTSSLEQSLRELFIEK